MRKDFVAFILTHGRPDKVYTYTTLQKAGYTGKVIIVIDNEDKKANQYIEKFGKDNVYIFNKKEVAKTFDEADNFEDRRAIVYARNVCFDIAKELGYTYFIELDDDYTRGFAFTFLSNWDYATTCKYTNNFDKVLETYVSFIENTPFHTMCFAQGGDFIGGEGSTAFSNKFLRKGMNSFICSTNKPFTFIGRLNEDINTYTYQASKGILIGTIAHIRLWQQETQSNSGGMTDIYLNSGTYVKSFYTVMFQPSSVSIKAMGVSNKRLHHSVKWEHTVPKIISQDYKKK